MPDRGSSDARLAIYWAKLAQGQEGTPKFHPLICPMIDVAVVAQAIWRSVLSPAARDRVAEDIELSAEVAERWVAFVAGLHDLGKVCPVLQLRKEARGLAGLYQGLPRSPAGNDAKHGQVTAAELPDVLVEWSGIEREVARRLAVMVGGQHGTFPRSDEIRRLRAG